jgi:hypothetical protein
LAYLCILVVLHLLVKVIHVLIHLLNYVHSAAGIAVLPLPPVLVILVIIYTTLIALSVRLLVVPTQPLIFLPHSGQCECFLSSLRSMDSHEVITCKSCGNSDVLKVL